MDGGEGGRGGQVHTAGHADRDQRVLSGSQLTAPCSPASSLTVQGNLATQELLSDSSRASRCSVLSRLGEVKGSR